MGFVLFLCANHRPSTGETRREVTDFDRQYAVQQAIKSRLKDPDSAKFGNVWVKNGIVCGSVNSKNSYGGYSGFKSFVGRGDAVFFEEEVKPLDFAKFWNMYCAD